MNSLYGYYNGENIIPVNLITPISKSGNNYEITVKSIDYNYNKTRYIFNEPYKLIIRKKKGNDVPFWYCAEDESLGINVMEESLEEAIKSFYSDIDFVWNRYANAKNETLGKRAIMLKNNINKLIKEAKSYDA